MVENSTQVTTKGSNVGTAPNDILLPDGKSISLSQNESGKINLEVSLGAESQTFWNYNSITFDYEITIPSGCGSETEAFIVFQQIAESKVYKLQPFSYSSTASGSTTCSCVNTDGSSIIIGAIIFNTNPTMVQDPQDIKITIKNVRCEWIFDWSCFDWSDYGSMNIDFLTNLCAVAKVKFKYDLDDAQWIDVPGDGMVEVIPDPDHPNMYIVVDFVSDFGTTTTPTYHNITSSNMNPEGVIKAPDSCDYTFSCNGSKQLGEIREWDATASANVIIGHYTNQPIGALVDGESTAYRTCGCGYTFASVKTDHVIEGTRYTFHPKKHYIVVKQGKGGSITKQVTNVSADGKHTWYTYDSLDKPHHVFSDDKEFSMTFKASAAGGNVIAGVGGAENEDSLYNLVDTQWCFSAKSSQGGPKIVCPTFVERPTGGLSVSYNCIKTKNNCNGYYIDVPYGSYQTYYVNCNVGAIRYIKVKITGKRGYEYYTSEKSGKIFVPYGASIEVKGYDCDPTNFGSGGSGGSGNGSGSNSPNSPNSPNSSSPNTPSYNEPGTKTEPAENCSLSISGPTTAYTNIDTPYTGAKGGSCPGNIFWNNGSTGGSTNYNWTSPGSYTVTAKLNDSSGSEIDTQTINVTVIENPKTNDEILIWKDVTTGD